VSGSGDNRGDRNGNREADSTALAHAPRNRLAIRRRAGLHFLIRAASKIVRTLRGRRLPDRFATVALVPGPGSGPAELGSALNRLAWYLGSAGAGSDVGAEYRVDCLVPPDLLSVNPVVGSEQRDYLEHLPEVALRTTAEASGRDYDWLLLDAVRELGRWKWLRFIDRIRIVDPTFYSGVEHAGWQMVAERTVDRAEGAEREAAASAFEKLVVEHGGADEVVVLGTGPSVEEVLDLDLSGRPVVICNSLVRNAELLERLQPAVLCFADEVFHLGPSAYAAAFRDDLCRVVEQYRPWLVTRPDGAALLRRHYPGLADRLIGIPLTARRWNVPCSEAFRVRPTGNIMTMYMLPVAARLGQTILIGGSDGRRPDETYFWRHGPSVQYDDLMATAFATHPSFFRDRMYADYYAEHIARLEDLLTELEARGHDARGITSSWIPALTRRSAPRPADSPSD